MVREQVRIRQEMQKQYESALKNMDNSQKVSRLFSISRFGVCNSDCPRSLPQGGSFEPMFVEGSESVTPNNVYMVEHESNIVFNLSDAFMKRISYDPSKDYTLCVLANGSIYTCSKEIFRELTKTKQKTVPLLKLPGDVDNIADFKTALGI